MKTNIGQPREEDLEILYLLVDSALAGKHIDIKLARSQAELKEAKVIRNTARDVVSKIKKVANSIYTVYINKLEFPLNSKLKDLDEAELLINYKKLEYSVNFYLAELKRVKHIVKEFRTYRRQHPIKVWLMNEYRPENELIDYTTIPWGL